MENNIYQRLLKATEEMATVAKNLNVQVTSNSSYKAVSERDVIDAVKKVEAKHGIYSYPYSRQIIDTAILENTRVYNGKETTTKQFYMRVETIYRFVNVDKPDEFIDVVSYGDGIDSGDKATGKAMTYADKYALMKAYKISTGEDPDQEASQSYEQVHLTTTKRKNKAVTPQTEADDRTPLIDENARLRATMDSYGIDYKVKHNEYILSKVGIDTQDYFSLSTEELKKLNKFYGEFIRAFKNKK